MELVEMLSYTIKSYVEIEILQSSNTSKKKMIDITI